MFGRLEQEDQRLKKHYGRWMDIVRSLELESFILTKLTKPSVPVNLVGPQVSLPLWWVPASRGSIHFFVRNKEALPCCGRGPSCQPLHVQSTSDGSRSLTTLTTPRREHQGGGRRRGLGRGRRGAGEDAAVDAHAERSTRVHWFGCGVRLPSPQGLASGGNSRGGEASAAAQPATGGRSMRHDRRCFGRLEQEDLRLKKH